MHTRTNFRTDDFGFWGGFTAGALAGAAVAAATLMISNTLSSRRDRRVVRLEDSVQVGRPVEEVFRAWAEFERLPEHVSVLRSVRKFGDHSEWVADINGKEFRWEAETTQVIPNEAIGWKSVSGPKHTGRINFSPIGNDTIVHISMNYAPPLGLAGLFSGFGENLDSHINDALRDFKAALEHKGGTAAMQPKDTPQQAHWREERRTGTTGAPLAGSGSVEYTRPPSAGYPTPLTNTKEK
jgi:uncharacterized membrane protein